MALIQKCCARP